MKLGNVRVMRNMKGFLSINDSFLHANYIGIMVK